MTVAHRMERRLRLLLRVSAVVAGSAILAVFMPRAWMDGVHRAMGLGPLPQGPVFEYLARSISALYALNGALYWFMSTDVRRYGPLIRLFAVAYILFGTILLVIDIRLGMPRPWILCEGPIVILLGCVFLFLLARTTASHAAEEAGARRPGEIPLAKR